MLRKPMFLTQMPPSLTCRRRSGNFLSSSPDVANQLILIGLMETIALNGLPRKETGQPTIPLSPPALSFSDGWQSVCCRGPVPDLSQALSTVIKR